MALDVERRTRGGAHDGASALGMTETQLARRHRPHRQREHGARDPRRVGAARLRSARLRAARVRRRRRHARVRDRRHARHHHRDRPAPRRRAVGARDAARRRHQGLLAERAPPRRTPSTTRELDRARSRRSSPAPLPISRARASTAPAAGGRADARRALRRAVVRDHACRSTAGLPRRRSTRQHARLYGYANPARPAEIVNVRVHGDRRSPTKPALPRATSASTAAPRPR